MARRRSIDRPLDATPERVRVHISPFFRGDDQGDGGIRRVVEAQIKHLPMFGIDVVPDIEQADLVACHAGSLVMPRSRQIPLVAHSHGLYWTAELEWPQWAHHLNRDVINVMHHAAAVTVPSKWVAHAIQRGMLLDPVMLYHGIEPEEWSLADQHGGYVLWNKTRPDPICDPTVVDALANLLPSVPFVSTFAEPRSNVKVIDRQPMDKMREIIRRAGVYLATPRETFGIGTLEAMACGIPVAGFRWGGQAEFIEHGVTGWLSTPGDFDDLAKGIQYCLANRAVMGDSARQTVLRSFTWAERMRPYASLYRQVVGLDRRQRPKVTVLITYYNLPQYITAAIQSVLDQTAADWQLVVVDDCSPEPLPPSAMKLINGDQRCRYVRTPYNMYLAAARNYGLLQTDSDYIIPLDADDMLPPKALDVLSRALDDDPSIDIAYGAMAVIEPDGVEWVSTWPKDFHWPSQMAMRNQLPYCSMMRRWVWARTGGYRERCRTAEDADFWCRVTSFGAIPKRVTDAVMLRYRNRPDSMSHVENQTMPDWTAWYPWSRKHPDAPFAALMHYEQVKDHPPLVYSYEPPQISVVIPVGPGHGTLVRDAMDSVLAQTYQHWEIIVVDDRPVEERAQDIHPLTWGFPHARLLTTEGAGSIAVARNAGAAVARGRGLVFLDADDYLQPRFLERCMAAAEEYGGYVYTDWYKLLPGQEAEEEQTNDPEPLSLSQLIENPRSWLHSVTALIPRKAFLSFGGFDASLPGWEDWDMFVQLRTMGICGVRVPEPLFVYRMRTGQRREESFARGHEAKAAIVAKWAPHYGGAKDMGCGSCGGGGGARASTPNQAPRSTSNVNQAAAAMPRIAPNEELVLVEYVGNGSRRIKSLVADTEYRFDDATRQRYILRADAERILGATSPITGRVDFRPVQRSAGPQEQPLDVRQRTPAGR